MHKPQFAVIFYFNPRPRKEGDITRVNSLLRKTYFNPRPRKEGDYSLCIHYNKDKHFNPRPRKEGDYYTP